MQTITKAEVIAAARVYYEKGLLTAQQEDLSKRKCEYKINGCRCAVGAVMTDETLEALYKDASGAYFKRVSFLWGRYLEVGDDPPEPTHVFVETLQHSHDCWCQGSEEWKAKFCEMIGVEPKEKPEYSFK